MTKTITAKSQKQNKLIIKVIEKNKPSKEAIMNTAKYLKSLL